MSNPTPPHNPFAPPQSEVRDVPLLPASNAIDDLPVSANWKVKFHLIEKSGGVKMRNTKDLSTGERMKVMFNILAFFFGPFYYLTKGMWKKGLSLFVVCLAAIVILEIVLEMAGLGRFGKSLTYGAGAVYAIRANVDYYKKMVLGQNGWW